MGTKSRKTLQELTFKDSFMFAAVMMDEENAKGVIERALDIQIERLEISYEKSIIYNPEYKGVRLDVYMKDENNTHFDVEIQVANQKIVKRARYYHSQIDMELLGAGADYGELPESYVIFICDFDPLGLGKYKYTRRLSLEEDTGYTYSDGSHTVYLSTTGTNEDEVSENLVKFLKYAGAELEDSKRDYSDELVSRLQHSVEKIKFDREYGRRYMLLEELMKDEYNAGKREGQEEGKEEGKEVGRQAFIGVIEGFLTDLAPIPENLRNRISSIEDIEILAALNKKAARAQSLEEFERALGEMKC